MRKVPESSFGRIFILFPDPWPKTRHAGRRFISTKNLDSLAYVLRDGGELRFASDNMDYVRFTLDIFRRDFRFKWLVKTCADWSRPEDSFVTRYEAKAASFGRSCVHLRFARKPRS